ARGIRGDGGHPVRFGNRGGGFQGEWGAARPLARRQRRGGRPVLTTAVSYPTEKRFRTGMTVAMFALILFMVTLISMVQGLQASSLDTFVRQQSGGYDVIAYTTSYGEIPNFRQMLQQNFSDR